MVRDHSEETWVSSDGVRGKSSSMVHGRWPGFHDATVHMPTLAHDDPTSQAQAVNKKSNITAQRSSRHLRHNKNFGNETRERGIAITSTGWTSLLLQDGGQDGKRYGTDCVGVRAGRRGGSTRAASTYFVGYPPLVQLGWSFEGPPCSHKYWPKFCSC